MTSESTYSETGHSSEKGYEPQAELGINAQAELALTNLPIRTAPDLDETCLLHGQMVGEGEVVVILSQLALRQIAAHSNSNLDYEVGGALLGRAFRNNGQVYLEVRAAMPAVTKDHGPVHFTFTADAWSQLHRDRSENYPNLDIVGWFHTHPDLGVFYSSDDVVVHSAAFTLPWHVGMVIDPLRKETGFFGWNMGSLVPIAGFYELHDVQPYSLLDWKVVHTAVWDHPYEYGQQEIRERGSSTVYLPPSDNVNLPALKSYAGFAVGALGLLLSFFLLVGLVMPLTREVDRLQNMVIVLADTALAESNAAYCPDPTLRILAPLIGSRVPVGSTVEVMGTAMIADAAGYQVNVRPAEGASWFLVDERRKGTKLGQLAVWDTESTPVGDYEMRLTAVDGNHIRLSGSPPCAIAIELTP
jgi:proteasome lid subunit RPN8/RPN11